MTPEESPSRRSASYFPSRESRIPGGHAFLLARDIPSAIMPIRGSRTKPEFRIELNPPEKTDWLINFLDVERYGRDSLESFSLSRRPPTTSGITATSSKRFSSPIQSQQSSFRFPWARWRACPASTSRSFQRRIVKTSVNHSCRSLGAGSGGLLSRKVSGVRTLIDDYYVDWRRCQNPPCLSSL